MGRGRGKRKGFKRQGKETKEVDTGAHDPKRARYDDPSQFYNDKFEQYYRAQRILRDEEDFQQFLSTLRTTLPICFRVNPLSPAAERLRYRLENEFNFKGLEEHHKVEIPADKGETASSAATENNGETNKEVTKPFQLEWYPRGMAWQLNMTRGEVKKNPISKPFHQWLVAQTTVGYISRQEAVSMIPPLLLDVQSHHKVLDMCASPGSKTVQLLEALHTNGLDGDSMPTGLVVANDNESKRAYMLIHQCKRIGSNALAVTCHDAQSFPTLNPTVREKESTGSSGQGIFDRVLCDVPCSGDGTLRKSPDIWRRWDPAMGLGVHKLQAQIALRGLELLKVGGVMVYSTCTFNPIEDEAVVKTLLNRAGDAVEIVDCTGKLPGLKYRSGLKHWKVMDSQMNEYSSYEESLRVAKESEEILKNKKHGTPEGEEESREAKSRSAHRLIPTMFPPSPEQADKLNLDRCMRFVPHDSNTGGFFVCVLKKLKPLAPQEQIWKRPSNKEEYAEVKEKAARGEQVVPQDVSSASGKLDEKQQIRAADKSIAPQKGVEPSPAAVTGRYALPKFHPAPNALKLSLKQFYGLKDSFPMDQLYVSELTTKKVYMVSSSVSQLCLNDQQKKSLYLLSAGVPILVAPTSRMKKVDDNTIDTNFEVIHRISSEGIHMVAPYVGLRRVIVSTEDFTTMLRRLGEFVPFQQYSQSCQRALDKLSLGCFVAVLDDDTSETYVDKAENAGTTPKCYHAKSTDGVTAVRPLLISCWKGVNRLNVMIRKDEADMMLLAMTEMGWIEPTPEERKRFLLDVTTSEGAASAASGTE